MKKEIDYSTIEIYDIDFRDYPDFCDAHIGYALYIDGDEVSDEDLEILNEEMRDYINEVACERAHGG